MMNYGIKWGEKQILWNANQINQKRFRVSKCLRDCKNSSFGSIKCNMIVGIQEGSMFKAGAQMYTGNTVATIDVCFCTWRSALRKETVEVVVVEKGMDWV